jgi:hypothetical protein
MARRFADEVLERGLECLGDVSVVSIRRLYVRVALSQLTSSEASRLGAADLWIARPAPRFDGKVPSRALDFMECEMKLEPVETSQVECKRRAVPCRLAACQQERSDARAVS